MGLWAFWGFGLRRVRFCVWDPFSWGLCIPLLFRKVLQAFTGFYKVCGCRASGLPCKEPEDMEAISVIC